ncbi:MAG TPA: 3-isopropylmalate dehydratase small subunit [Xanthobacteraceae bacterium]|nr:3-isopropylmalate dehydratase small subunit [Xanthobacteraceae bacterium]
MLPFTTLTGIAIPLLIDDINTDQITPAQARRSLHPDYHAAWFSRWRLDEAGNEIADCVLNAPQYRGAPILVTGRNFGCGSAREGAAWAMVARGIRCIVARSFSDFYRANCVQNGILPVTLDQVDMAALERAVTEASGTHPVTVDLEGQAVISPDGERFSFTMDPAERMMLLEGLDDIGLTMKHMSDITGWEQRTAEEQPWLQAIPKV